MNITDIKKVLPVLMRNKITALFWGPQGVGKTQTIQQVSKSMGEDFGFVHLHLATQEVGDLTGLLVHGENGTVHHARPEWFPTSGRGIVFLDEINRATPDVIQSIFSFITSGTIHRHKLPEGWSIVAAANYNTAMFNVTDTNDSAFLSRFCHIDFQPTCQEFTNFAEKQEAWSVAEFIRSHPELADVQHKERLNQAQITPDRRSWLDMIARLEKEDEIENQRYELYSGIVGAMAAATFMSFKTKAHDRLSGRDVLNTFPQVKRRVVEASNAKSQRFDLLNGAVEEIMLMLPDTTLTTNQMNNFKDFLLTIPLEMNLKVFNRLHEVKWKQKNEILNNQEFVQLFKTLKVQGSEERGNGEGTKDKKKKKADK